MEPHCFLIRCGSAWLGRSRIGIFRALVQASRDVTGELILPVCNQCPWETSEISGMKTTHLSLFCFEAKIGRKVTVVPLFCACGRLWRPFSVALEEVVQHKFWWGSKNQPFSGGEWKRTRGRSVSDLVRWTRCFPIRFELRGPQVYQQQGFHVTWSKRWVFSTAFPAGFTKLISDFSSKAEDKLQILCWGFVFLSLQSGSVSPLPYFWQSEENPRLQNILGAIICVFKLQPLADPVRLTEWQVQMVFHFALSSGSSIVACWSTWNKAWKTAHPNPQQNQTKQRCERKGFSVHFQADVKRFRLSLVAV